MDWGAREARAKRTVPVALVEAIGAVLTGIVAGIILSLATDVVLHAPASSRRRGSRWPTRSSCLRRPIVLSTTVAGSYIMARLAPDRPMQHALAGGVVGLALSTVGAVATWNRGPAFAPHWYPLALIATAMPCAWAGGRLRVMQLRARQAP